MNLAYEIFNHDCRKMPELKDNSVHCVVTSPPYWGLRKYAGEQDLVWGDEACLHKWNGKIQQYQRGNVGTHSTLEGGSQRPESKNGAQSIPQGQFCRLCNAWRGAFGLEPTPEMYVQHTIEILREVRRVLRKDGVVFWNIADSYAGSGKGGNPEDSKWKGFVGNNNREQSASKGLQGVIPAGLKPKDLCLIPFRVAIAAQEAGWWVRSVIIWNKPNPMPESVTDRPTGSHEYILMLTKSAKYYWDAEAVREPQTGNAHSRGSETCNESYQEARGTYKGFASPAVVVTGGRNLRSVWTFPTQPFPGAHFAVFPEKLPELCIKASTPEYGVCSKCGSPWARIVEKGLTAHDGETEGGKESNSSRIAKLRQAARERGEEYTNQSKTLGWKPTCKCGIEERSPALVLDPFSGAGTTAKTAVRLGRSAVGYELSKEYAEMTKERLSEIKLELL